MRAVFGPVHPATAISQLATKQIRKATSDFAREVPEGTRYVGEKCTSSPCDSTDTEFEQFSPLIRRTDHSDHYQTDAMHTVR